MRHLSVLVMLLLVLAIACKDKKDKTTEGDNTGGQTENVLNDQTDLDSTATNVEPAPGGNSNTTTTTTTTTTTVETPKQKYYVIVGSFKDFQNAQRLLNDLNQKGSPSEILEKNKEFTRVSFKVFDTKAEALVELDRVKNVEKKKDAWILTK